MSSTTSPQTLPPNDDRGASFLAILWTLMFLATTILAARIYIRLAIKALGKDDFLMLISWAFYAIAMGIWTAMMLQAHAGRHVYYLTPEQITKAAMYGVLSQPMVILALGFGKCSVGFLLLRIIDPHKFWRKWFLYIHMAIYLVLSVLVAAITVGQCSPVRANWESVEGQRCWDPRVADYSSYLQSSYGVFMDFSLAIMPITIFWHLNLNFPKKVALIMLMSLGFFTGTAAIIKTTRLKYLGSTIDFTWQSDSLGLWTGTEQSLILICGSLPCLKPFRDKISLSNRQSKRQSHSSKYFAQLENISKSGNISKITAKNAAALDTLDDESILGRIHVESTFNVELESLGRSGD